MITAAQVKSELKIESDANDDLIDRLILCVESLFEQITNKKWTEQTAKQNFNTMCDHSVFLSAENVSFIYFVASGIDSAIVVSGQDVNLIPTVTITSTSLFLVTTEGTTELKFTEYKTLAELVAGINAINNWAATVNVGYSGVLSQTLIETAGNFCEVSGTDFYIPGEYVAGVSFDSSLKEVKIPEYYAAPITVQFKCGYNSENTPAWLKQVLIRQVCHWYHQAIEKRWNVSNITLGDGGTISYGEQKGNLLSDFVSIAEKHKRIFI